MPQPSITQRNAAWAEQFKNATTNAAQRARYAEDRAAGMVDEDMRDAAEFEAAQQRDPKGFGKLMLDRARENRMGFQAEDQRNFRERDFSFRQNRAARQDELAQKKLGLDLMKADLAVEKDLRDVEAAAEIKLQTKALQDSYYEMRKNGIMPGMPGFAEGIGAAIINNPNADPDVIRTVVGDARIDMDPTDMLFESNRLGIKNPKFTVRQDKDGRTVYGMSEGAINPTQETGKVFESFDALKAAFPKGGVQFDLMPDGKVRAKGGSIPVPKEDKLGTMMGGGQSPAPAATPPRIKVNPQTGERIILKDGAWQPLP